MCKHRYYATLNIERPFSQLTKVKMLFDVLSEIVIVLLLQSKTLGAERIGIIREDNKVFNPSLLKILYTDCGKMNIEERKKNNRIHVNHRQEQFLLFFFYDYLLGGGGGGAVFFSRVPNL